MTSERTHRQVTLERIANGTYTASNARGGQITVGSGTNFTPVELLLTALAGCTAIDVDILTSRRAEPDSFIVEADAERVRDEKGRNLLTDITVTFRIRFPAGEGGDAARTLLPDAVQRSHERLCTVSRTVELGTPVTPRIKLPRRWPSWPGTRRSAHLPLEAHGSLTDHSSAT